MKGFAFTVAAVLSGQALAIPSHLQDKRAEADNGAKLPDETDVYGAWVSGCGSMSTAYCTNYVWPECIHLFSDASSKAQRQQLSQADLDKFEKDVKACIKLRDPATNEGLCYDLKLSKESCQKYRQECRKKNEHKLNPEQGYTEDSLIAAIAKCIREKPQDLSQEQPTTTAGTQEPTKSLEQQPQKTSSLLPFIREDNLSDICLPGQFEKCMGTKKYCELKVWNKEEEPKKYASTEECRADREPQES
ncbi:uncharacterized protein BBA_05070 [Beauveria bassiana ARSEF 2860]|uniref:Uncharacterized protein n=1 Tax=Beauveria bassiana (strain ARSEF 2860) TaxID=655819 RepID=J4KNQ2_BEAB2|nr:uncharacterized protein BBA_05070 [Beauveria bassiana ARSEF 2860]EJP66099.1 hypothetical protein BBA_05070 [Beauveria bassiana ARSEF 2860]